MSVNTVKQDGSLQRIAGGTLYADAPVGTIQAYGGVSSTIPQGWLYCNGAAVSRTTYAELFAVIGTSFGAGDGSTTFNIPDLRGEFLRGAGTNSHANQGNGGTVGQHQDSTIIPRIDSYSVGTNASMDFSAGTASGSKSVTANPDNRIAILDGHQLTIMVDNDHSSTGTSFDNYWALQTIRPTNTSVNYIIKAKQSALPADIMSTVESYVKSSIIVQDVFIDMPAQQANTQYTLEKVITIPSGYKVLAFGAISNNVWGQTLRNYTFDSANNKAIVAFYNGWSGTTTSEANAVKITVILDKV